jgi:hypothetical protein
MALLALCALPVLAAWLALAGAPAVAERSEVAFGEVAHALAVARSHDPRRAVPGQAARVSLTERDLELLLNHAAHRLLPMRVQLSLEPQQALLVASLPVRWGGVSGWANLHTEWRQTAGLPELASWRVGRLPLPRSLAGPLLRLAASRLPATIDLDMAAAVVRQLEFGHDELSLSYVWQHDTSQRLLAALTPPDEQQRLRAYAEVLARVAAEPASQGLVALPQLIGPLFDLARQRSLTHDAARENRAAILTLALYVTGRDIAEMVPAARNWPQPRRLQVLLNGRDDFPQHFLVSAMLAIEGTRPFTNAVGLYKEVADAHGGSGFSFNDLAANRAGLRFGQFALEQPGRLQQLLARGIDERSLMPDVADLPEFLTAAEFTRRFQRIGSPGYNRLLDDIERRVEKLALYR